MDKIEIIPKSGKLPKDESELIYKELLLIELKDKLKKKISMNDPDFFKAFKLLLQDSDKGDDSK